MAQKNGGELRRIKRDTQKKRHEKYRFGPVETVKLELVCAAACSKLEKGYGQEKKKEG